MRAVVALGGNAFLRKGEPSDVGFQGKNAEKAARMLARLKERGYQLCVTHGNGPQVGSELLRNTLAQNSLPPLPLDYLVAVTQGWMGYMLELALCNSMPGATVTSVVTLVEVSAEDPAFAEPTKPVGAFYTEEEKEELARRHGWKFRYDPNRKGWRAVVPSPEPLKVLNASVVSQLLEGGSTVVAGGGGGVPLVKQKGLYRGVEAVIDKDLTSALLAEETGADALYILTDVERIALNFGKPDEVELERMSVAQAQEALEAGQFPPGSMGPKVRAAVRFAQRGGEAIIGPLDNAESILEGRIGTRITL